MCYKLVLILTDVTGPDQNYPGVDNDLYTNVAAGYALFFGRFLFQPNLNIF